MAEKTTLDVRQIPPPRRHPMIFGTWEALESGEAFVLVNDHDYFPLQCFAATGTLPLYYTFNAELPGLFTWDYLEKGPSTWRVRIGKK